MAMVILCVDGDEDFLAFYRETLARYDLHVTQSIDCAYALLASQPVDMVVVGEKTSDGRCGLALLEYAASVRPTVTRVFVARDARQAAEAAARAPAVQVVLEPPAA